jgi:hypothetical protein
MCFWKRATVASSHGLFHTLKDKQSSSPLGPRHTPERKSTCCVERRVIIIFTLSKTTKVPHRQASAELLRKSTCRRCSGVMVISTLFRTSKVLHREAPNALRREGALLSWGPRSRGPWSFSRFQGQSKLYTTESLTITGDKEQLSQSPGGEGYFHAFKENHQSYSLPQPDSLHKKG